MEQNGLQPAELLSSDEFRKNSEHIIRCLKVPYNCDTANDLRQEMAIAVIESIRTYKPDRIGKNFWGHANLRMRSRAETFLKKYGSIVRLPINRQGGSHWEKMGYAKETVSVSYFDGWESPDSDPRISDCGMYAASVYDRISFGELYSAVHSDLSDGERYVMMVKLGWVSSGSEKTDFKSVSEDLGVTPSAARKMFISARDKLFRRFSFCAGASCGGCTS